MFCAQSAGVGFSEKEKTDHGDERVKEWDPTTRRSTSVTGAIHRVLLAISGMYL
jgi:hypothetical protein